MISTIDNYIRKNGLSKLWRLQGILCHKDIACVVVIPAFAEYDFIFDTLFSLSASSRDSISKTQVIVVVNNRVSATHEEKENNNKTLVLLENLTLSRCCAPLSIALIDASTPGNEFPETDGVGSCPSHRVRSWVAFACTSKKI